MKVQSRRAAAVLSAAAFIFGPMHHARAADPVSRDAVTAMPAVPQDASASDVILDDLDLRDVPLRDALSLIGLPAGLNLAASDEAAKVKVTVRLRNVSVHNAVQTLCQTQGLFFQKPADQQVGIVTTVKEFQQGLTVFREEKTEIYTLLYPNAMDLAAAIHDLFGDRVRLNLGKQDVFDETDDIQRRFETFDLLDSRSQGLAQSFSSGGGGSGGSGSGGSGGSSNSNSGNRSSSSSSTIGSGGSRGNLANQNRALDTPRDTPRTNELRDLTPEQLNRVAGLLRQEGVGTGIDAEKLLGAGRNTTPIYVSVITRNNQVIVRTSDQTVLEEIAKLKNRIDVPTPQVLLEVKVLSVDLTDGFTSVFDMQFGDSHNAGGFSTGAILPPPPGSLVPAGTGAGVGSPFALNQTAMIYQWVNDNFRVRMQLLDDRNKVTTLATPMLLVANNEVSRVFIGEERPIVRNISSQTTATQGVITQTPTTSIDFRPVGTTLLITPNINADRTVTLRLLQEKSDIISGGATIPIVGNNGSVTNQPVDVVSARTLTGTVIAKDGLSLALGGLIEEGVQDTREEVPVLGRLPIVGYLFRRQATGRYRHEVIIVIRPYILSTPSEAEEMGKKLTESNSIHPSVPNLNPPAGEPIGSMNTYLPHEVARPNPPRNKLEKTFRFHSVLPTEF